MFQSQSNLHSLKKTESLKPDFAINLINASKPSLFKADSLKIEP